MSKQSVAIVNLRHARPTLAAYLDNHPLAKYYFVGTMYDRYYAAQGGTQYDRESVEASRIGAVIAVLQHMEYPHFGCNPHRY